MSSLIVRIGGDGPVVVETDAAGWRLIVRGQIESSGIDHADLHTALRQLALRDPSLAEDAFGVVCNCAGSWEDDYTEEYGEDALTLEDWLTRIGDGAVTWVNDEGEIESGLGHSPSD